MFGRLKNKMSNWWTHNTHTRNHQAETRKAVLEEIADYYRAHKTELAAMEREGFLSEFYAIRSINADIAGFVAKGRHNIKVDPMSPLLIYVNDSSGQYELGNANSVPFHVDPYAYENVFYSHVDLADGINSVLDRYIASYQLAKEHDLQSLWLRSSPAQVLCLDGRLEIIEETIQKRIQPAMDRDTAMLTFLDAYAKDIGEQSWRPHEINLYAHFNDEKLWSTPLQKEKLPEYLDRERVAEFIIKTFGSYVCKDGSVLDPETVRDYLRDIMQMETRKKQPPLFRQTSVLHFHPNKKRKFALLSDIGSSNRARFHFSDPMDVDKNSVETKKVRIRRC